MPTSRTHTSTSPRSRTSSRAGTTARNEIIAMLKDDHKRVKKAFRDFEKLDPHEDPERCQSLVAQTCSELEIHAKLEEELFYPAARDCLGDEDLIDEAEVEHMSLKMLIGELQNMAPEDEKFAATFKVLGEYVKHHVGEEEGEIFPQLSHAKFNWEELQGEMTSRREALMTEYLPQMAKTGEKPAPAKSSGGERASGRSSQRQKGIQDDSEVSASAAPEAGAGEEEE